MHPALACAALGAALSGPKFEHRVFYASNGLSLPYRLVRPVRHKGERPPLILFLHGAGERGTDNEAQLVHGRAWMEEAAAKGAYVVAPQCPPDQGWSSYDWRTRKARRFASKPGGAALQLVAILIQELRVDRSRVYIGGLSMGGFGTFDLVSRRPKMFAAAFPICGGGDAATVPKIKDVPFWVFHGAKDPVVPVGMSRSMVDALESAGANPRYTEYPEAQHDSWNDVFAEPELLGWLFSQRKA